MEPLRKRRTPLTATQTKALFEIYNSKGIFLLIFGSGQKSRLRASPALKLCFDVLSNNAQLLFDVDDSVQ